MHFRHEEGTNSKPNWRVARTTQQAGIFSFFVFVHFAAGFRSLRDQLTGEAGRVPTINTKHIAWICHHVQYQCFVLWLASKRARSLCAFDPCRPTRYVSHVKFTNALVGVSASTRGRLYMPRGLGRRIYVIERNNEPSSTSVFLTLL